MKRRMTWAAVLAVCVAFHGATAATAAENVLTVIPDNVAGVVVINHLQQTNEKIARLAKQLQQSAPDFLALAQLTSGLKEGVDQKGVLALAVLIDGGGPVPILFVPTTDYAALVKQLGGGADADDADADDADDDDTTADDDDDDNDARIVEVVLAGKEALAGKKGGYAVLVERNRRDTLEAVLGSTKNVAAVAAGLGDWPAENDVFAVATPTGIKLAQQQILMGLAIMKAQIEQGGAETEAALPGLELYETLFQSLDKEIECFAIGLRVQPDGGLHLGLRSLLTESGRTAKRAQYVKPASDGPLAGLPKGPFVVAGGGPFPLEWTEELMDMSIDMMKAYPGGDAITDDVAEKLAKLSIESTEGLRSMSMMFGGVQAGQPLYDGMVFAMQTDDAKKYMATYERTVKQMQDLFAGSNNPMFSYTVKKIKIGEVDGLKVTMDMAAIMAAQKAPEAEKMLDAMFGKSGKLSVFLAPIDEHTVLGTYVSKRRLVRAIRAGGDPEAALANNPGIRCTAKMLPEGAQWIGYWSPRGMFAFAKNAVATFAPDVEADVPEFPPTPPVGFAVKLTPKTAEADVAVPAAVLKAAAQLIRQAQEPEGNGILVPE